MHAVAKLSAWARTHRRRIVRWAAIILLAPYLFYLVVGNVFLWLGGVPWITNRDPQTVVIEHGATFTWWPGHLWAKDVRVSFQSDDFQFRLSIREVTSDISLVALFSKRFVADDVDAAGVSWRMRFKHAPENTRDIEALPPIPAFGPFALVTPARDEASPDDEPWSVHLTNVRSQVNEMWIEFVRFAGDASVAADFEIVPMHHLRVTRASGVVRSGHVESAGERIFDDTALRFHAAIPWFDIAAHPSEDIIAYVSAVVEGTSTVDAGAAMRRLRIVPPEVDVSGGDGQVYARGGLQGERVVDGSIFRYVGRDAGLSASGASIQSIGTTYADLLATGDVLETAGRIAAAEIVPVANPTLRARFETATALAYLSAPTLRGMRFERARIGLPSGALNLGAWTPQNLGPVTIARGAVFGRASMTIDRDGIARGAAHLEAYESDVRIGVHKVTARASADIRLDAWDIGENTLRFGKSWLELRDVAMRVGEERVTGWYGRFDLHGTELTNGERGPTFRTTVRARGRDATPVTAFLEGEELVPGIAADMLTMEDMRAETRLVIDGDRFDAELVEARGDGASAKGRFAFAGGDERGAVVVYVGPVSAGVAYGADDSWLRLLAGKGWLDEQRAAIDGWLARTIKSRGRSVPKRALRRRRSPSAPPSRTRGSSRGRCATRRRSRCSDRS